MSIIVGSVTSVMFYPKISIANGAVFATEFTERTGGVLDHEPIVLPFQQPAPPQAPRIVLRSRDGQFACEVAMDRVSFHYADRTGRSESIEGLFPRYREVLYRVITALGELLDMKPARLGFVTKARAALERPADEVLREHFIRVDRFAGAVETHLHFLDLVDLEGTPCNQWTRLRAPRARAEGQQSDALFLELDVNTRAEYQHRFEPHEVMGFFLEAYEHVRGETSRLLDFDEGE